MVIENIKHVQFFFYMSYNCRIAENVILQNKSVLKGLESNFECV